MPRNEGLFMRLSPQLRQVLDGLALKWGVSRKGVIEHLLIAEAKRMEEESKRHAE